jgi:hypothetical protein
LESDESIEVVKMVQYSVDPTLILGSDVSINHVFSISSSGQGEFLLILSMLSTNSRMVSLDRSNIVDPHLPYSSSFKIRVEFNSKNIYQCISDEGASASILSSLSWKDLGSPRLCQLPVSVGFQQKA